MPGREGESLTPFNVYSERTCGNLESSDFCVIGVSQQLLSLLTHCGRQMCLDISEIVSRQGDM